MTQRSKRYEDGLAMRRQVLGDDYVDQVLAQVDGFSLEFQDFLNEHVWGAIWTRPGLDRRTRSLVTIAVLATRGKSVELKAHTVGALRNGCTPQEIKEVFLQLAVYAGAPVAVEAFRVAQPVIAASQEPSASRPARRRDRPHP